MSERRARTVLITGASSGLGAALALALAARGDRLALTARRGDRLDRVAAEVDRLGGSALVVPADLADPEAPARIVEAALSGFGRLDAIVNNAGLGLPRYFAESDPAALRDQVSVNFTGPIVLTRLALPHLLAARGTVVNIGSGIATVANPILGAYGATKAGLSYWSDALRREVAHRGVSVCHVDLGPVDTDFFDAVRLRSAPGGRAPLGVGPPPDALYNAMRDRPPALMTTRPDVAARAIARLLDRPRRRLALPRRLIWPLRLVASVFDLVPPLGDLAINAMIRRVEREESSRPPTRLIARRRPGGRSRPGAVESEGDRCRPTR